MAAARSSRAPLSITQELLVVGLVIGDGSVSNQFLDSSGNSGSGLYGSLGVKAQDSALGVEQEAERCLVDTVATGYHPVSVIQDGIARFRSEHFFGEDAWTLQDGDYNDLETVLVVLAVPIPYGICRYDCGVIFNEENKHSLSLAGSEPTQVVKLHYLTVSGVAFLH